MMIESAVDYKTISECISQAESILLQHNVSDARLSAEQLFMHTSGLSKIKICLGMNEGIDQSCINSFIYLVQRRKDRYPLQYLLGDVEFFGSNFKVSEAVLIPRPETEILVEAALNLIKGLNTQIQSLDILEIGTGAGCIAVSLAKYIQHIGPVKIVATDISSDALKVARENAFINKTEDRIEFIQADMFDIDYKALDIELFDLIVSNPPYVVGKKIDNLQPEIGYEPRIALDGGEDGLFYINKIIREAPHYLKDKGTLVMEIGFGQVGAVKQIFSESAFNKIEFIKDYQGIERVVILYK